MSLNHTSRMLLCCEFSKLNTFHMGLHEACLGHQFMFGVAFYTSQVLISLGVRWKIECRSTISIWWDLWLKRGGSTHIFSSMFSCIEDWTVSYLFNPTNRFWNTNFVRSIFNDQEAKRVLDIALITAHGDDEFVCDRSRNGIYSVKSTYYGAMNDLIDNIELRVSRDW